MKTKLL